MTPALRAILTRPFTPAQLPGLIAWWDASDPASVWADTNGTPATPGGLVRCWKDKVSGVAADQATGSYQPTLVNGGIGARSIQFAGLHALDVPLLPVVRCGIVVHRTSAGTRASLFGSYPQPANTNFEVYNGAGLARFYYGNSPGGFSTQAHSTGVAVLSSWVTGPLGAAGEWGVYKNGQVDTLAMPPATSDPPGSVWRIGADWRNINPASAIPQTGWIAEILALSATPPAALLAKLHGYLIKKWSIV